MGFVLKSDMGQKNRMLACHGCVCPCLVVKRTRRIAHRQFVSVRV